MISESSLQVMVQLSGYVFDVICASNKETTFTGPCDH